MRLQFSQKRCQPNALSNKTTQKENYFMLIKVKTLEGYKLHRPPATYRRQGHFSETGIQGQAHRTQTIH